MCLPGTIETVRERVEQEGLPKLDRRKVLLGAAGAALATALPAGAHGPAKSKNRLQDLTHVLRKEFPLFLGTTIPTERDVSRRWMSRWLVSRLRFLTVAKSRIPVWRSLTDFWNFFRAAESSVSSVSANSSST